MDQTLLLNLDAIGVEAKGFASFFYRGVAVEMVELLLLLSFCLMKS